MEKYYIVVGGDKKGPYALSQLRKMWDSAVITMDTKYASEGMDGWADIGDLMEEAEVIIPKKSVDNLPTKSASQASSTHETEEIIFEDDKFCITKNSFATPDKTFLMRNIVSVKIKEEFYPRDFSTMWRAIFGGGLLTVVLFSLEPILGIAGVVATWVLGMYFSPDYEEYTIYYIKLKTSAGSATGYSSRDEAYIKKIKTALNKAISQH